MIGARARSFFHFNKLGTMFHPCVRGNFSVKAIAVYPSTRQSYMPRVCFEISAVSGEFFVSHILPSLRLIGTKLKSSSRTISQLNVERSSKKAICPKRSLEKEFQENIESKFDKTFYESVRTSKECHVIFGNAWPDLSTGRNR